MFPKGAGCRAGRVRRSGLFLVVVIVVVDVVVVVVVIAVFCWSRRVMIEIIYSV